jgi:arginine decarboxylase
MATSKVEDRRIDRLFSGLGARADEWRYPPGFPIMVPGQVITQSAIDFMRKLDVKEIHGYNNVQGLKLVRPDALAKLVNKSGKSAFRTAAE